MYVSEGPDFIQVHKKEDNYFERVDAEDINLELNWVEVFGTSLLASVLALAYIVMAN